MWSVVCVAALAACVLADEPAARGLLLRGDNATIVFEEDDVTQLLDAATLRMMLSSLQNLSAGAAALLAAQEEDARETTALAGQVEALNATLAGIAPAVEQLQQNLQAMNASVAELQVAVAAAHSPSPSP